MHILAIVTIAMRHIFAFINIYKNKNMRISAYIQVKHLVAVLLLKL